jgi:hypothetical protein
VVRCTAQDSSSILFLFCSTCLKNSFLDTLQPAVTTECVVKKGIEKSAISKDENDLQNKSNNVLSMSGLKSLLSKTETSEKHEVMLTTPEAQDKTAQEATHHEESRSFGNMLSMSGLKSFLSKGGDESKANEESTERDHAVQENDVIAKVEEKSSSFGAALSVSGFKSLFTGHTEEEVKKVEKVDANESVSIIKEEVVVTDLKAEGKVYFLMKLLLKGVQV